MRQIDRARARAILALTLLAVVGATVVGLGLQLRANPAVSRAETDLLRALDQRRTAFTDAVAMGINVGFGPIGAAALTLLLAALLAVSLRSWRTGAKLLLLVVVPWGVAEAVKLLVRRPRPDRSMWPETLIPDPLSTSFPSGHTAFSLALTIAVALMLRQMGVRRTAPLAVAAILIISLTAWSRMYLGVHHPTDVLASAVLVPVASAAVWTLLQLRTAVIAERRAV